MSHRALVPAATAAQFKSGFNDFEDGVQFASAKDFAADYIVTGNKRDFKKSDIPIVSPLEALALIASD